MRQGNQLFPMIIFLISSIGKSLCCLTPFFSLPCYVFCLHASTTFDHWLMPVHSNFFHFCQALFSQTLSFLDVLLSPSNLLLTTVQLHSYLSCCCYYHSFRMKENSAFRPSTWMLSFMTREVVWQLKGLAFHLQCGLDLWQCTPLRQT